MNNMHTMNRREFLTAAAAGATAMASAPMSLVAESAPAKRFPLIVFSKVFQELNPADTADLVAEAGLDGIECPVRKGGQVEPEKVEDDLPLMAEALAKCKVSMPLITTDILKPGNPLDERVLKTAAKLGISLYRLGFANYTADKTLEEQMQARRDDLIGLAQINKKYSVCACFQNHSGPNNMGAPVWDIHRIISGIEHIGAAFDIGHATIEGGNAWRLHARLMEPYYRVVYVKDFVWGKNARGWASQWRPLGQGMISPEFFKNLKRSHYSGPISLHVEYPVPKGKGMLNALKKDVATLKGWLEA
jgi:sugar phosphate isomerase/epimerase